MACRACQRRLRVVEKRSSTGTNWNYRTTEPPQSTTTKVVLDSPCDEHLRSAAKTRLVHVCRHPHRAPTCTPSSQPCTIVDSHHGHWTASHAHDRLRNNQALAGQSSQTVGVIPSLSPRLQIHLPRLVAREAARVIQSTVRNDPPTPILCPPPPPCTTNGRPEAPFDPSCSEINSEAVGQRTATESSTHLTEEINHLTDEIHNGTAYVCGCKMNCPPPNKAPGPLGQDEV